MQGLRSEQAPGQNWKPYCALTFTDTTCYSRAHRARLSQCQAMCPMVLPLRLEPTVTVTTTEGAEESFQLPALPRRHTRRSCLLTKRFPCDAGNRAPCCCSKPLCPACCRTHGDTVTWEARRHGHMGGTATRSPGRHGACPSAEPPPHHHAGPSSTGLGSRAGSGGRAQRPGPPRRPSLLALHRIHL